jgi:nitrogen fixation protein NifB
MQALTPERAMTLLAEMLATGELVDGVTIAGPGDPLADSGPTFATLELVRGRYPDMAFGVTTLGLGGALATRQLAEAGVSRVTLLVDAVDLEIMRKLYAWIRPGSRTVPLVEATAMLLTEQAACVQAFIKAGCRVDIRTTIYPGYNDGHAVDIACAMAELGAQSISIVPYEPVAGEEALLERPGCKAMTAIREQVAQYLPLVLAPEKVRVEQDGCGCHSATSLLPKPSVERPNVAVVSHGGMEVDLHLGHAATALIYGPRADGLTCLLETRSLPEPGAGAARWGRLADILKDCFVLLAAGAGESPRKVLADQGISVLITEDDIEGVVEVLYGGGKRCKK